MRTLPLVPLDQVALATLRENLVKIGAGIVRHRGYVIFQLAEIALSRALVRPILRRIDCLRGPLAAVA